MKTLQNVSLLVILFSATTVFAEDTKFAFKPSAKQPNIVDNRARATDIILNTTEDGDGRYYKVSGSVSFKVDGKSYHKTFSNIEVGGFSETVLSNQDNEDRFYPEAYISKPLGSDTTTLVVAIIDRNEYFIDSIGVVAKKLK